MKECTKCGQTKPLDAFNTYKVKSGERRPAGSCKACDVARARRWKREHPDRAAEHLRNSRAKRAKRSIDERRAENRRRYLAQRDRLMEARREAKADLERWCGSCGEQIPASMRRDARYCSELCRKRAEISRSSTRRRVLVEERFVEHVDRAVVFQRDAGVCGLCGERVDPTDFHVDHIVPLSAGGEHSYANSQVSHPRCNRTKGAAVLERWCA